MEDQLNELKTTVASLQERLEAAETSALISRELLKCYATAITSTLLSNNLSAEQFRGMLFGSAFGASDRIPEKQGQLMKEELNEIIEYINFAMEL